MNAVLGIDVGGTGIKGAVVDLETGRFASEKIRLKTAHPASPASVIQQLSDLVDHFNYSGQSIGIGFPAVIKNGKTLTAGNIDPAWINFDIVTALRTHLAKDVFVINDADAAGTAEQRFGHTIDDRGLNIFLTLGTGIGSAFFYNGTLIPNTELGHIPYKKTIYERHVSNKAREMGKMSWQAWGTALNSYLKLLELLFRPDKIILGGGVSKRFEKYQKYFTLQTEVVNAGLLNKAGIIGAAVAADKRLSP